jgi:predicted RNase H-like nuclease (RuvC/YqgF family)
MEEKIELLEKENADLKLKVEELEKALENQKKYAKGLKKKAEVPAGSSKAVQH